MVRIRGFVVIVVGTLALASAWGLLAAISRPDEQRMLTFVVFALLSILVFFSLLMVVLTPDQRPRHHEDTVENEWVLRAGSGAFFDLLFTLGIATAVTKVLAIETVDSALFLVLAMADFALRFWVLRRRGAG